MSLHDPHPLPTIPDPDLATRAAPAPATAVRTTAALIAVLTGHHPADRASVHRTYLNAIWLAGGQPVVLSPPPAGALESALDVLGRCDAVLITGGGDVEPERYGEPEQADLMHVDEARDTFELAAVDRSIAAGRPILGICRGMQVLAVALGGRLHQDIPTAGYASHWHEHDAFSPVHGIRTLPGSLAAQAVAGRATVNSIHHQAVADPGPQLVASAWSDDDLIEAVEGADGHPMLGIQWHPERLACSPEPAGGDPAHLAPFQWLMQAARGEWPAAPHMNGGRRILGEDVQVNGNGHGNGAGGSGRGGSGHVTAAVPTLAGVRSDARGRRSVAPAAQRG